jgi:hypothetical protein
MTQLLHLIDKRAVVSAIVVVTFVAAFFATDAGTYAIILGILGTGVATAAVLLLSYWYGEPKPLWFALDLAALLSGLVAVFIGFAKYQESEHAAEINILKSRVVERHLSFLRAAKISYFECSEQVAAPVVEPADNCSRLGHFISQIEDELQRPSLIEKGESNRWDLNLCPQVVKANSKSWGVLCESAKSLAAAQAELRKGLSSPPAGAFVSLLGGKSLLFWLILTGLLYGGKIAKFIFDAGKKKGSIGSENT